MVFLKKLISSLIIRRLLVAIIIIALTPASGLAGMVSIAKRKVNMRSGPGTGYAVLWELGKGFPLKVEETKGRWLKVSDFEGDVGWVYKPLVSGKPHLIVKKRRINVRSGPGTNYKIVGKANYGVVFKTLDRRGSWIKVRHENGLNGWVMRKLLWGW